MPPRTVLVNNPYGAQWGPPNARKMHRIVVEDTLAALLSIELPGTIIELPHTWSDARRGKLSPKFVP